jgi:hypothetical protein
MLSRIAVIALVALITIGFSACSKGNIVSPFQTESQLEKNWGRSFEAAKYNQTLNPDADQNLVPVEGMEGPAAERIMGEYIKGGTKTTQPSSPGYGVLSIQK